MPRIELEVSPEVLAEWQAFLKTARAGRLIEAGFLGDWVCLGFMAEVDRYLAQGRPIARQSARREREEEAVQARKRLAKPQRRILPMFNENDQVTLEEMARVLGMAPEDLRPVLDAWLAEGFLSPGSGREGQPTYTLSKTWQEHQLAANRPSLNVPRSLEDIAAAVKLD